MRAFLSFLCLATVLVLGCASTNEGVAQERKPRRQSKKPKDEKKPTSRKNKKKTDPNDYEAVITDRSEKVSKPFTVTKAVLFVPEVTLFGGGAGEEVKELKLKFGSAEITVPFARIASIEVGDLNEDRLELTVTLRDVKDPADAKLKGTVKASLEMRGKLGNRNLDTIVKLREAKSITLAVKK